MKAKLVKTFEGYELHILNNKNNLYMPSAYFPKRASCRVYYLSKQNCDEIFGIYSPSELSKVLVEGERGVFEFGYYLAREHNKDKVFTLEEVHKLLRLIHILPNFELEQFEDENNVLQIDTFISHHIQQPIEIDVVIEDKIALDGHTILGYELDSEGCLILKKL
jgi:hypothetical protein